MSYINLYAKYNDRGFEILDFPCNQFANQAPESNQDINKFCITKFGTKFKQFAKIDVNGKEQSDLYKFLKENSKGVFGKNIKWNFTKFLINKNGEVVGRFAPTVKPEDLDSKILELL